MSSVGIRELKNRLSECLRLVRGGEDILVTDRGVVVAELRQPGSVPATSHPSLDRLVREGYARPGAPNRPDLYPELSAVLERTDSAWLLDAERDGH